MSKYCETCVCLQGHGQWDEGVEEAINGGCLPCEGEVKKMVDHGIFWSCHDREEDKVICQGAVSYAKKIGVEIPKESNIGQCFDNTNGKYEKFFKFRG